MKKLPRTLRLAITIMIACALGGCSLHGDLCARAMECRGGNDADYDACIIDYEAYEDRASLNGCNDDLDLYLECYDSQAKCNNDNFTADNDCNDELDRLNRCID